MPVGFFLKGLEPDPLLGASLVHPWCISASFDLVAGLLLDTQNPRGLLCHASSTMAHPLNPPTPCRNAFQPIYLATVGPDSSSFNIDVYFRPKMWPSCGRSAPSTPQLVSYASIFSQLLKHPSLILPPPRPVFPLLFALFPFAVGLIPGPLNACTD